MQRLRCVCAARKWHDSLLERQTIWVHVSRCFARHPARARSGGDGNGAALGLRLESRRSRRVLGRPRSSIARLRGATNQRRGAADAARSSRRHSGQRRNFTRVCTPCTGRSQLLGRQHIGQSGGVRWVEKPACRGAALISGVIIQERSVAWSSKPRAPAKDRARSSRLVYATPAFLGGSTVSLRSNPRTFAVKNASAPA